MRNVALLFGGAISASTLSVLFDSCTNTKQPGDADLFTPGQQNLITEIADTILPTTATPGAKAAGVGPFIAMMIDECYPKDLQKAFIDGLEETDTLTKKKFDKTFVAANEKERSEILTALGKDAQAMKDKEKDLPKEEQSPAHFFSLIKELTMLGYFTSEIGVTKALNYVPLPGRYDGDYPVKDAGKAWAI